MSNRLFVISGPSGVGKTSLCNALLKSEHPLSMSVSCTTRNRRKGEVDGKSYHFLDKEEFNKKVRLEEFAEYAQVYGNYYGTLRSTIEQLWSEDQSVLFNVDIQGTAQLQSLYSEETTSVLIVPPDMETLENRLRNRGTDNEETIETRLSRAHQELSQYELFDFIVKNDCFQDAVQDIEAIYAATDYTIELQRYRISRLLET